jgi:translation initiation factor IF-3
LFVVRREETALTVKTKTIRRRFFRRQPQFRGPRTRVNEYIRISPVRLIDEDGQQVGVVPTDQALKMARQRELDLVEIVPNVRPPIVKIMDFGKFQYQKAKEEQQQRAKQKKTEVKGIRFGLKTDDHDLEVRRKMAEKFLSQKNKVKIEIRLRGREKAHQPLARQTLNNFILSISAPNKIEQEIKKFPGGFNVIIAPN